MFQYIFKNKMRLIFGILNLYKLYDYNIISRENLNLILFNIFLKRFY